MMQLRSFRNFGREELNNDEKSIDQTQEQHYYSSNTFLDNPKVGGFIKEGYNHLVDKEKGFI